MTSDPSQIDRLVQALRTAIDARLQPPYLRTVSIALLLVGVVISAVSFATSDRGRTLFGPPLGGDFSGFYIAAQILERDQPTLLYDRVLHDELYHELNPTLALDDTIPYVHPPFVAGMLRPLTLVSYESAVAIWMALSLGLFVAGVWCLLRSSPALAKNIPGWYCFCA